MPNSYSRNLSCLKINFQKNEVFVIGVNSEEEERIAAIFNCKVGSLPLKYLGVMISDRHMFAADLAYVHQKVAKKITNLARCHVIFWREDGFNY